MTNSLQIDHLVGRILSDLYFTDHCYSNKFGSLLDGLKQHEQKKLVEAMIHNLQARCFSQYEDSSVSPENEKLSKAIAGVSAIVDTVISGRQFLKEQLKDWLVSGVGGGINSISMRRSLLIALEKDSGGFSVNLRAGPRGLSLVLQPQSSKSCKKASSFSETSSPYSILQSGFKKVIYPFAVASSLERA